MTIFRTTAFACVTMGFCAIGAFADVFGTGVNQFTINFVTISGATNPTNGYGIVANDYRMGVYEITNTQWDQFKAIYGPVTGWPFNAYGEPLYPAANVATERSWLEAAQFVNWLNTSTGHHAAYNFTGTQGTSNYMPDVWSAAEAENGTNLFRHKDAMYYLPSEDEWVKAAYWNGTALQTYATKPGDALHQGNGTNGTGWNYYNQGYATNPMGLWAPGSGSQELNGTYDMMGNIWEWTESPEAADDYDSTYRAIRGGGYANSGAGMTSGYRSHNPPAGVGEIIGFRVASDIPEPASLALLALGGLLLSAKKR